MGGFENSDDNSLRCAVSSAELEARSETQRNDGLEKWTYDSPFAEFSVQVDDVNDLLESRLLKKACNTLERVTDELKSRRNGGTRGQVEDEEDDFTSLEFLQSFVSDCLLEKLRYNANRVLHVLRHKATTKENILGPLIMHVLCASHDASPTTVCNDEEGDFFIKWESVLKDTFRYGGALWVDGQAGNARHAGDGLVSQCE